MTELLAPESRAAALKPLNLAVLMVALVAGLTVTLWLLPLGVVVYVAAVALGARDPAAIEQQRSRTARRRLAGSSLSRAMQDVDSAVVALEQANENAAPDVRAAFARVLAQSADLSSQAHVLANKGVAIEAYLTSSRGTNLDADVQQLTRELASVTDETTRRHLTDTRQALLERRASILTLTTYLQRIAAQIANIAATLGNAQADLLRIQAGEATGSGASEQRIERNLSDLRTDLGSFLQTLDSELGQGADWDHRLGAQSASPAPFSGPDSGHEITPPGRPH